MRLDLAFLSYVTQGVTFFGTQSLYNYANTPEFAFTVKMHEISSVDSQEN